MGHLPDSFVHDPDFIKYYKCCDKHQLISSHNTDAIDGPLLIVYCNQCRQELEVCIISW